MPRSQQALRIVSYHYDAFSGSRTQMTEATIADPMNVVEADPSTLKRSDELLSIDSSYITSTSEIYQQRNQYLRPLMVHEQQSTVESTVNGSQNTETEAVSFRTDLADSSVSIQLPVNIRPPTVKFVITETFKRLLEDFNSKYFVSFPDIPCAYCGVLCLSRTVHWIEAHIVMQEWPRFGLVHVLNMPVHRDGKERVAICFMCKKSPREAPSAGPWPEVLLRIPQRSKMFLSPIKLNCNLGRTQSHSRDGNHNPYSTYRTLSGKRSSSLLSMF